MMGDHDDKEVDSHLSKDSGKASEDELSAVKKQLSAMHLEAIREPEGHVPQPPPSHIVDTETRQSIQEAAHPSYNALHPSYNHTAYLQQPSQSVASQPTQMSPQEKGNKKRYKKRMSAEEKQQLVLGYLNKYYQSCVNASGNVMLMELSSGTLYPPGVDEVSQAINAACFYQIGIEVSNSAIRSALAKFTERSSVQLSTRPVYGRAGYVQGMPPVYVINRHDGTYRADTFSPHVSLWAGSSFSVPYVVPHRSLPLEASSDHFLGAPQKLVQWFKMLTGLPETSLLLVVAWMMLTWMPDKKQVLLELRGADNEHVVNAQRVIKQLIDPSRQLGDNLLPTGTAAFYAFCQQEYVLSLERFDSLTPKQQKNLLSVMDRKEVEWVWRDGKKQKISIEVQCPVVMSCLESPLTDSALIGRTVSVDTVAGATDGLGLHAKEIIAGMVSELLSLFGLVQQGVYCVALPEKAVRYRRQGPLSDFCRIGEVVATSLGYPEEHFWEQLHHAQRDGQEDAYESDDIAQALVQCWSYNADEAIELSMTDWLELLPAYLQEGQKAGFPETQKALSVRFKKASEVLKAYDLLLEPIGRIGSDRRAWRLRKMPEVPAGGCL